MSFAQPKLASSRRCSCFSLVTIAIPLIISSCTTGNNAVFESFRTLNESLSNESVFIANQNALLYKSVESNSKDPMTFHQTMEQMPRISRVKAKSNDMMDLLHQKETDLMKSAGIKPYYFKYDYNDEKFRIKAGNFIDKEFGRELDQMMKSYRDSVYHFDSIDNEYVKRDLASFLPNDSASNLYLKIDYENFQSLPVIAVIALIRNYEIAIRKIEYSLIRYFHMFTVYQDCGYDKFMTMAILNRSVINLGESIEVTAGVGAFSLSCQPDVTINGKKIELGPEGAATYSFKPRKTGKHSINVRMSYSEYGGGPRKTESRKLTYEVVELKANN